MARFIDFFRFTWFSTRLSFIYYSQFDHSGFPSITLSFFRSLLLSKDISELWLWHQLFRLSWWRAASPTATQFSLSRLPWLFFFTALSLIHSFSRLQAFIDPDWQAGKLWGDTWSKFLTVSLFACCPNLIKFDFSSLFLIPHILILLTFELVVAWILIEIDWNRNKNWFASPSLLCI